MHTLRLESGWKGWGSGSRGLARTGWVAVALMAAGLHAAASDYLWIGPTNGYTTANWNTPGNWSRYAGGSGTYPNAAGDHIEMVLRAFMYGDGVFGVALPSTFTQATFGSCTVSNYTAQYYTESAYMNLGVPPAAGAALRVLNLNNGADPVVLQSHLGTLHFGRAYPDNDGGYRLDVRLISERLIVTNGTPTTRGAAVVYLGGGQYLQKNTTLSGGTVQAPRRVTIQAGHQDAKLLCRIAGTNTSFIGTWTVIGPKTYLDFARNTALGTNSLNSVTLKDDAKLTLNGHMTRADPSWTIENRTVQGVGSVSLGIGKPLELGTGGCLIPGETSAIGTLSLTASNVVMTSGSHLKVELAGDASHDSIAVTVKAGESLTLGGSLDVATLDGYEPTANQTWPIITCTGSIAGVFDTVTKDYEAYVDGTTVMLRRLPPAGTVVLLR